MTQAKSEKETGAGETSGADKAAGGGEDTVVQGAEVAQEAGLGVEAPAQEVEQEGAGSKRKNTPRSKPKAKRVVFDDLLGADGRVNLYKARVGWPRHYRVPGPDKPLPGVNTLVGARPRPHLERWKPKEGAKWRLAAPGLPGGMDIREAEARALDIPNRAAETSRQRGAAVHNALEFLPGCSTIKDRMRVAQSIMKHTLEEEAFADLVAAAQLLDDLEAEILYAEALLWRLPEKRGPKTVVYAGALDLLLGIPPDGRAARKLRWKGDNPIIVVADLKTGKSVWEGPLAVGAYAGATHLVEPDGAVLPMPAVHKGPGAALPRGGGDGQVREPEGGLEPVPHRGGVVDQRPQSSREPLRGGSRRSGRRQADRRGRKAGGPSAAAQLLPQDGRCLQVRAGVDARTLDVMTGHQPEVAHGVLTEKWGRPNGKGRTSPNGIAHLVEESVRAGGGACRLVSCC